MEQNIISTLVSQHRELQKNLKCVVDQLDKDDLDISEIDKCLNKFSVNLTEHLKLENDFFYTKLIKVMEDKGQDTSKTQRFIYEMKDIEIVVLEFLKKFGSREEIQERINDLKSELPKIIETLSLRMETEEAGVYAYWGLF